MTPCTIRPAPALGTALLALLAVLAGGCGRAAPEPTPPPAAAPDPCVLPTGAPGEPRRLTVAIVRPEDTAAVARPQPEPLIRLDCQGTPRPAAAESWSADDTRHTWTLVLRPSALDVTAAAAAAQWRTDPGAATTLRHAGIATVLPLDELRLVVTFDRPQDSVPAVFADPSLALVTDSSPNVASQLVFRLTADARDALDAGADLVPTDDPDLLEYARARDELAVHALPWNRTYVLVIPPGQQGFDDLIPPDSAGFMAGLARDAVRVKARPAEGPFWWTTVGACPDADDTATPSPRGLRVTAQAWDDPVGRAVAERLVALSRRPMTVIGGLHPRAPIPSIQGEGGMAFVVPVPRRPLVPCREIAAWPEGARVIPLIDTQGSVVVRRGGPPLTVDFDGRIRTVETP